MPRWMPLRRGIAVITSGTQPLTVSPFFGAVISAYSGAAPLFATLTVTKAFFQEPSMPQPRTMIVAGPSATVVVSQALVPTRGGRTEPNPGGTKVSRLARALPAAATPPRYVHESKYQALKSSELVVCPGA